MLPRLRENLFMIMIASLQLFVKERVVAIHILSHPQDKTAGIGNGSYVVLDCLFDTSAPLCYWEKDGVVVKIDERYEFEGDPQSGNCSIVINEVAIIDEGKWRCGYPMTSRSISSKVVKSAEATVSIAVLPLKPVITFNTIPLEDGENVNLDSQDDLKKFRCWSENGLPEPIMEWKIGGNIIRGHTIFTQSASNPKSKISESRLIESLHGLPETNSIEPSWLQECLYCMVTTGSNYQETCVRLIF